MGPRGEFRSRLHSQVSPAHPAPGFLSQGCSHSLTRGDAAATCRPSDEGCVLPYRKNTPSTPWQWWAHFKPFFLVIKNCLLL